MDLEAGIKRLTNEICNGKIDCTQFLNEIARYQPLTKEDYIELVVRTICMKDIKTELRNKQRNILLVCSILTGSLVILLSRFVR
jgi:hypothetical protein